MRIRFNGMITNVRKSGGGGCSCHKSVTGRSFVTHKTFILPSNQTRSFHIGEEYEVNDVDGNFLLSYSQIDKDGLRQDAFTRLD